MQQQPGVLENPYGYFDTVNREYVITRPDTPTPWINYIGEGRYGGIISNTAGGYSFDRDPRNRRITRYRYNSIPEDQPGRYIYIRDQETGIFWSATWQPTPSCKLDAYECRHGAGYSRINSEYLEISSSILYFVPIGQFVPDVPCEFWVMRLKNSSDRDRLIRTFSYVEFCFFDAMIDQQNFDWGMHIVQSSYKAGAVYTSTKFRPTTSFFSSSISPLGYDTNRETFIGKYRDLSNPVVVETGETHQSQSPRGNSVGVLEHEWHLQPGEEKSIVFVLGVTDFPERISEVVQKMQAEGQIEKEYLQLNEDWTRFLDAFKVETPDKEMNAMINFWNPVQCRTTLYWSRFISAYESGLGRGMGTRDSAQDSLATVITVPNQVRDILSKLFHLQFKDGHTWHQFFPLTGEGGPGLAAEFPDWPQWFSDDHLWLVIAVCAYLKETGDFQFLEEKVEYWDGQDPEVSIWDHLLRSVKFTLSNLGPHGLPRIGFSDWDDTMNIDHGSGKAESVWVAQQFCRVMLDLVELCDFLGKDEDRFRFMNLHTEMSNRINQVSWDGEWYARAFDDDGLPMGVKGEAHHAISLNTQTWSVIGELGDRDRQKIAMDSIDKLLNTPYGISLMSPPYNGSQARVRGTSTYPPGAKENGGIFCHANAWGIVAAAMLGDGDLAYKYYRQILPLARNDADRFLVEPYVYSQNICGPDHPQYGTGRNAWLTGTAAWTYVAGTQYILGIRSSYGGLIIKPTLPRDWMGFKADRLFRGVHYRIEVVSCKGDEKKSMIVDGKLVEGNLIDLPGNGVKEVCVEVHI